MRRSPNERAIASHVEAVSPQIPSVVVLKPRGLPASCNFQPINLLPRLLVGPTQHLRVQPPIDAVPGHHARAGLRILMHFVGSA